MTLPLQEQIREQAQRSKYRNLYHHLCGRRGLVWNASFAEIETILGFKLPPSARRHREWWGNQSNGNGHVQSLAWTSAGWDAANVNLEIESLTFCRRRTQPINLDEIWPVHPTLRWPKSGMSLRREDLYEDRI